MYSAMYLRGGRAARGNKNKKGRARSGGGLRRGAWVQAACMRVGARHCLPALPARGHPPSKAQLLEVLALCVHASAHVCLSCKYKFSHVGNESEIESSSYRIAPLCYVLYFMCSYLTQAADCCVLARQELRESAQHRVDVCVRHAQNSSCHQHNA